MLGSSGGAQRRLLRLGPKLPFEIWAQDRRAFPPRFNLPDGNSHFLHLTAFAELLRQGEGCRAIAADTGSNCAEGQGSRTSEQQSYNQNSHHQSLSVLPDKFIICSAVSMEKIHALFFFLEKFVITPLSSPSSLINGKKSKFLVIASEAKQPRVGQAALGCFASLAMTKDGSIEATKQKAG
jgi:hypothetical protein